MLVKIILLSIFLISCSSTKPTPYIPEKGKVGYTDSTEEGMKVAIFKANSYSKKERAHLYAEFRALENCRTSEKDHTNLIDVFDLTIEKEVTRSTSNAYGPSYYYGMYPNYRRYSGIGFSANFSTVNNETWNETLIYPIIKIYYSCSPKIFRPQITFEELTSEQMKFLVKDVTGAVQVDKIMDEDLNKRNIQKGDIIIKASGNRIDKVYQLMKLFKAENPVVDVTLLREGKLRRSKIRSRDITEKVIEHENEVIGKVCEDLKKEDSDKVKKSPLCLK